MLQEEAILLQNQDSYRLPQYIENLRYGPDRLHTEPEVCNIFVL